jgi:MFS superfamily sulfate permease-like transporter
MLPDALLSVVLFMAVIGLVDWKLVLQLTRLRRDGMVDLLALVIAFSATCFLGVVPGMASAIGFSLIVFVFNSSYPQIEELSRSPGTTYYTPVKTEVEPGCINPCIKPTNSMVQSRIKVLRFEAPLWFANASRFLDRMLGEIKQDVRALIIDMSTVPWVDFSAGIAIKEVISRANDKSIIICFAHVKSQVQRIIQAIAKVDDSSFFATNFDARMSVSDKTGDRGGLVATDGPLLSDEAIALEVIDPASDSDDDNAIEPATPPSQSVSQSGIIFNKPEAGDPKDAVALSSSAGLVGRPRLRSTQVL